MKFQSIRTRLLAITLVTSFWFNLSAISAQEIQPASADKLVIELMKLWESGNDKALFSIAHTNMVYDDIPNNHQFIGIEQAQDYIKHVHNWASNVRIEIKKIHAFGDAALAEWVMTGIQSQPIKNRILVATNKSFVLPGSTLIEVKDGKIIRAADYIDVLGFVVQLGAEVKLPGGKVISLKD